MTNRILTRALGLLVLSGAALSATAQTANFNSWTRAGDALIGSATAVTLTTAASESGETPISGGSALLPDDLALALALAPASLAADTYEGSGTAQSFTSAAGTTISFAWTLTTVGFDGGYADRAFVIVDGSTVLALGTVAASPVSGSFSHTFATAGSHALAIVVMDVNDVTAVSTLALSNLQVTAVPEPASLALLLAGLGIVGGAARRRCG